MCKSQNSWRDKTGWRMLLALFTATFVEIRPLPRVLWGGHHTSSSGAGVINEIPQRGRLKRSCVSQPGPAAPALPSGNGAAPSRHFRTGWGASARTSVRYFWRASPQGWPSAPSLSAAPQPGKRWPWPSARSSSGPGICKEQLHLIRAPVGLLNSIQLLLCFRACVWNDASQRGCRVKRNCYKVTWNVNVFVPLICLLFLSDFHTANLE